MGRVLLVGYSPDYNSPLRELDIEFTSGDLGFTTDNLFRGGYEKSIVLSPKINIRETTHENDVILLDLFSRRKEPNYNVHGSINRYKYQLSKIYADYSNIDYRPIGSYLLKEHLDAYTAKKRFIIVFSNRNSSLLDIGEDEFMLYDFNDNVPSVNISEGDEINLISHKKYNELNRVLVKHKDTFEYKVRFEDFDSELEATQHPLMKNYNNDVISYLDESDSNIFLFLPNSSEKDELLFDLITSVIPEILPEALPEYATFEWLDKEEYLFRENILLNKKKTEKIESFKREMRSLDDQIEAIRKDKIFFHKILTATDAELVNSLIEYLEWLEFENVLNVDEEEDEEGFLKEDIRVTLEENEGVLVIECKGIGGTSKDHECSQVLKFKTRLQEERQKFDVFGLYIVNHERHIEPINRSNPPFQPQQIKDAKNDKRGLITTWQLFNLHRSIEEGVLTKKQARKSLLKIGLVDFIQDEWIELSKINQVFKEPSVITFNDNNSKISKGDKLVYKKRDQLKEVKILSIQVDNKSVEETSGANLEYGFKVDSLIPEGTKVWLKK